MTGATTSAVAATDAMTATDATTAIDVMTVIAIDATIDATTGATIDAMIDAGKSCGRCGIANALCHRPENHWIITRTRLHLHALKPSGLCAAALWTFCTQDSRSSQP